ncbi:hypothetical protein F350042L8_09820 [Fusobacterium ulcerans]|uniref:hypothetical protein n=1 Tax=Fusobacterium ulcerans TaxID=861 RepID=UPI0034C0A9A4
MYVIKAAIDANEKQKKRMVEKIIRETAGVEGKHIAILGLSFKPDTDDMRDAPNKRTCKCRGEDSSILSRRNEGSKMKIRRL